MSVPAALIISRIMVPAGFSESGTVDDRTETDAQPTSSIDAIAQGTAEGLQLLAYVTAMLVVMIALVALANSLLGLVAAPFGVTLTLQRILGWVAGAAGLADRDSWGEAQAAGALIGIKTVLNEMMAYLELARTPETVPTPRSRLILDLWAVWDRQPRLARHPDRGMMAMAPERRAEIVQLGPRTVLAGTLATPMTGAVVGLVVRP